MKKTLSVNNYFKKSKLFYLLLMGFGLSLVLNQQGFAQGSVGVGTATPDKSAALDVTSTTGGVLVPRLTTAQRNAIATPANGLLVYNTDDSKFNFWDKLKWSEIGESLTWFTGQGLPNNDMGKLDDLYLDQQTGYVYQQEVSSFPPQQLAWTRRNLNKSNKQTLNIASSTVPANGSLPYVFDFVGAKTENAVACSPAFSLPDGIIISHAWVSAPDKISVKFYNIKTAGGAVSIAGNYQIAIF
ncbi:hypothetical protein [Pedobacter arcticus]|uniref:hypothetical protein n=1 Tax=Pedobacter arcticus TaxID=752140 RepID=UPI00031D0854|nr:hypothetical protein [Pedobacter arcticus]